MAASGSQSRKRRRRKKSDKRKVLAAARKKAPKKNASPKSKRRKAPVRAAVVASLGMALPSVPLAQAATPPVITPANITLKSENEALKLKIADLRVTLGKTTSQRDALVDTVVQEQKKKGFWHGSWCNLFFGVVGGLVVEFVLKVVLPAVKVAAQLVPVIAAFL
jgi:hypothetical protein